MTIRTDTIGSVRIVTIDRPDVANAVDRPTARSLADALRSFEQDTSADVAVLHGAGGTFCAGADLQAMLEPGGERASALTPDGDGPVGPTRLELTKPVIAAVEGHAVAGGLELALWCDLRVAAQDAIFGVYCRRWGIPLMDGGTVRLPRLIGRSHALDMVLTGRGVSGDEARVMGLVNRLVPPGTAVRAGIELATHIAGFPQAAARNDRASLLEQEALDMEAALLNEYHHGMAALDSGEFLVGLQNYAAQRSPSEI